MEIYSLFDLTYNTIINFKFFLATGTTDKTAKLWQLSANGSIEVCVGTLEWLSFWQLVLATEPQNCGAEKIYIMQIYNRQYKGNYRKYIMELSKYISDIFVA